ncbi:MAG TPA: NAD(+)/NADH kinase [Gemmatimonadales bacterium]
MIVGVFGNPRYPGLGGLLERLLAVVPTQDFTVHSEDALAELWPSPVPRVDLDDQRPDAVICFGGDGTMLRTTRAVGPREIPILGVKIGRVGFLTSATPEMLDDAVMALSLGNYDVESRRMLQASIHDVDGQETIQTTALNDVVVHKAGVARVVRLRVVVEEEIGTFSSDGLIVASPTGSTAYSLSAGGPIVLPGVDALVVTPICPHTLAIRPFVVPGDSRIVIELVEPRGEEQVLVSYDGQVGQALALGDQVVVTRAPFRARLIRLGTDGFFTRMQRKLQWGDLSDRDRD